MTDFSPSAPRALPGTGLPIALRYLITVAVAAAGGWLFAQAHVPLAWMIGAMCAAAIASWGFAVALPKRSRPAALIVLGSSFGTGMSTEVLGSVLAVLPYMIVASVLTLAIGAALTRPMSRLAHSDLRTGFFCMVPGGVTVMPILAEEAGADVRAVTLSQTVRMVIVVLTLPLAVKTIGIGGQDVFHATTLPIRPLALALFLAAALVAALLFARLRASNPWILGPLILSILITATWRAPSGFPPALINAAQVAMGAGLGIRLNRQFVMSAQRLLAVSAASTLLLTLCLALAAGAVAAVSGLAYPVILLGMAPGGTPEMVVTAAALGVSVPMVLGFHLVRMLASNLLIAPMWRLFARLN